MDLEYLYYIIFIGLIIFIAVLIVFKLHTYYSKTKLYANDSCKMHEATEGLQYTLLGDGYSVSVGEAKDKANIVIPSFYNNLPIISIGYYAFEGCTSLTSITIPNSVTSIGYYAFLGCSSLKSIIIPNSVTSIGIGALKGCSSLKSVTLPFVGYNGISGTHFGYIFGAVDFALNSLCVPSSLKEVIITDKTSIGQYAFLGCSSLESITIPEGVTNIGQYAFYKCKHLKSITIPNSVTSIGICAFYKCKHLKSIAIPNSVTSIGKCAFERCSSLTNIIIQNSIANIDKDSFNGCYSLKYNTYNNALYLGNENNPYLILTGTKNKKIVKCKIHENAKSICNDAFEDCISLTTIKIPNSVTSIGYSAFSGCSSLESITFEEGSMLTIIDDGAFNNCGSLTSITIPNSLTNIKPFTFSGCNSLESITIPNSVIKIDTLSFLSCNSLTNVYYKGTEEQWNAITIEEGNNDYLTSATITYNYVPEE